MDTLAAVHNQLSRDLEADHADAERSLEGSAWIAGVAIAVSIMLIAAGVFVIGRFLLASVDRLVDGAERFAAGDRDHRIEVHVPPELNRVAEEFNRMIGRIRASEEALADLARRDRLTGLLNRRALDIALVEAIARRERLNADVSALVVDIDHFKRINDGHGHHAGDEVIRAVATTITSAVREVDRAFRFGGEEFVVLLNDSDRSSAAATAERVRTMVEAHPISVNGATLAVTVSIGAAAARHNDDGDKLIAAADAALYRAKQDGRNRVVVADADR